MAKARSHRNSGGASGRKTPDADRPDADRPEAHGAEADDAHASGPDPDGSDAHGRGASEPGAASGADADLFRAAVRDVTPLPRTERTEPLPGQDRRRMRRHATESGAGRTTADPAGHAVEKPARRAAGGGAGRNARSTAGRAAAGAAGLVSPREDRRRGGDGTAVAALEDAVLDDDPPTGADTLSFHRPGVRMRTLKHLRRGLYPIEEQLDLHGLSQAAARDSLGEFLEQSRGAGYRCVRIVHGKGYRSGARGPILKIAVNTWLKRHPDVMAFTSARPIDGGTGAVYVLLRA
jgi:DNA-nicking Smr family endonuclease